MPECKNCGRKWKWSEAIKRIFSLGTAIICPYCEEKQYLTNQSRRKMGILHMLLPLLLLLPLILNISFAVGFTIFAIAALVIFSMYPFIMELTNEDEIPFGKE
ncbi:TIGR04104 family putative zinc finger protein [Virgibacillus sp. YIM 98842]|jgi:CXXC-20-CXXC protein|uniref:TIGR04104 family putative zinc finger protein n=1 Tax=Virgibacillus sp. YIM 98842 TaxID=2663533 RepID=UPI0013DD64B4|nr:TIGR04104 family putative zinc finger protein [Virgibacillus sp. YIM 98842]